MPPHRLPGGEPVAGDLLLVAALLLGVDEIAAHREGRPAGSDRPAPHLDRRGRGPVGRDSSRRGRRRRDRARESPASRPPLVGCEGAEGTVAGSPVARDSRGISGAFAAAGAEGAPRLALSGRGHGRRPSAFATGGAAATGSAPACASRRSSAVGVHRQRRSEAPSPRIPSVRTSVHTPPASRRPARSAAILGPRARRRLTDGPGDQGEAEDRDGVEGQHRSHVPARDRRVNDLPRREDGADDQGERAHALEPGCPAEEEPPHDDHDPESGSGQHGPHQGPGSDDRHHEPGQPLQRDRDGRRATAEAASGGIGSSIRAFVILLLLLLERTAGIDSGVSRPLESTALDVDPSALFRGVRGRRPGSRLRPHGRRSTSSGSVGGTSATDSSAIGPPDRSVTRRSGPAASGW